MLLQLSFLYLCLLHSSTFFFFNDTATTEIYTLSLHDALPINPIAAVTGLRSGEIARNEAAAKMLDRVDRKSTRLNSSHTVISYAVFCLKKKKKKKKKKHKIIIKQKNKKKQQ